MKHKKNVYLSESQARIIRNLLIDKIWDIAEEIHDDCESAYEDLFGVHPLSDTLLEYQILCDKITRLCNIDFDDFNLFDGEVN